MSPQSSILVVANRTAASNFLIEALKERARREDLSFSLVVPATPGGVAWAADMDSGEAAARRRMDAAVRSYLAAGLRLRDARVGHPDPLAAALDAVHFGHFSEIVVSTLPRHLSAWLRLSLPHRVAHATGLPVTHVEVPRRWRAARARRTRGRAGHRTVSAIRGGSHAPS
jgi:hypothetical protein